MSEKIIGLFGHNSKLAKNFLSTIPKLQQPVKVRIYHRASSDLSDVDPKLEKVVVDYDDRTGLVKACKGLDVAVSTIGNAGLASNIPLGKALKEAGVKCFIPSYYTTHEIADQAEADLLISVGAPHIVEVWKTTQELKKLGVPMTLITNGLFTNFAMMFGFVVPSIQRNAAEFYKNAENIPYPLSSMEYVGAGIAEVATAAALNPSEYVGRTIALIQFKATGKEMIGAISKVNGSPVQVTYLTDEEAAKRKKDVLPPPSMTPKAIDAHFKQMWGEGKVLQTEDVWEVKTIPKIELEDYVRQLKATPLSMPGR